jgi:dienelactone hydrolase
MMGPSDPLPADVRGVYELDTGEQLTLVGTEARVTVEADGVTTSLPATGVETFGSTADGSLTVTRDEGGAVTGLALTRDGSTTGARRVEPYQDHEVTFDGGDELLAGSLLVPTTDGPHPGVVIVHGAERATRETYRLLATHYARRGVAVLIYDKRGTGASTGDVAAANFHDLTADALAGHAFLRDHPGIDPNRIGVAGFSQGGWIAALAARATRDVAFVVAYSGSGFSPGDQHAWLYGSMLNVRGMGPRAIEAAERFQATLYSTVDLVDAGYLAAFPHVPGFWFHALDHRLDTTSLWQDVSQPVLGIWGTNDCQVPANDSAAALRDALERGSNPRYTLRVLDGADHGLHLVGPCVHELGGHADEMRYAPGYLAGAADWIARLDVDPPAREYEVAELPADTTLGWHHDPPGRTVWYGHAVTQALAVLALLVAFAGVVVLSLMRGLRRRRPTRLGRLVTATAATGLAAVLVGFAALGELAALGATHAAQLVGDGPIAGMPPLFLAAAVLVTLTVGLAVVLAAALIRAGARPGRVAGRIRSSWVTLTAVAVLAVWASYWQLPWVPGGLL